MDDPREHTDDPARPLGLGLTESGRGRPSLTAQLVNELRSRIARGEYRPGDRIPTEQILSERFGVSRSVVREAISSLRAEGLVTTRQGIGAFVQERSAASSFQIDAADLAQLDEVLAVLELRSCIEVEAAALAADRRSAGQVGLIRTALDAIAAAVAEGRDAAAEDLEFHRAIALATGNRHFANLFASLGGVLIPRTRIDLFKREPENRRAYLALVQGEHEQIVVAIEQQDPDAARAAMLLHLSHSSDRLRAAGQRGG
jgi:DNA-binding FadR family transcriptional regulator